MQAKAWFYIKTVPFFAGYATIKSNELKKRYLVKQGT